MLRSVAFWTGLIANGLPCLAVAHCSPDVELDDDEDPILDALVQQKAVDGWVPVGHVCGPLANSDSREKWAEYAKSVIDHAEEIADSLRHFGLKRDQVAELRGKVRDLILTLRKPEPEKAVEPEKDAEPEKASEPAPNDVKAPEPDKSAKGAK